MKTLIQGIDSGRGSRFGRKDLEYMFKCVYRTHGRVPGAVLNLKFVSTVQYGVDVYRAVFF